VDDQRGVRSGKFFRLRLLTATPAEIQEQLKTFRNEGKEIRSQIITIAWHMRGGVTRDEAWTLSYEERKEIMKYIEERVKIVEKTRLPLL
jgi:hypothetical protein